MKKHIDWLDGLKFVACMGVFSSHFASAFIENDKNLYAAEILHPGFYYCIKIFGMFLNGAFQVRIFCIIAGLLAAKKEINSFNELILAIIKRYLRFVVPFFSAGMFLLVIEYSFGYHAQECGKLLNATWIGTHNIMPVTIYDVLRMTFLFDTSINGPLWTIRPIFMGTCIIYLFIETILFKVSCLVKYVCCNIIDNCWCVHSKIQYYYVMYIMLFSRGISIIYISKNKCFGEDNKFMYWRDRFYGNMGK